MLQSILLCNNLFHYPIISDHAVAIIVHILAVNLAVLFTVMHTETEKMLIMTPFHPKTQNATHIYMYDG